MNITRILQTLAAVVFSSISAPGADSLRHPLVSVSNSATPPAISRNSALRIPALPALPPGVSELTFADFYKQPIGPLGLEYSDRLKSLDGNRVRIVGYMVRQSAPVPWMFLLSPIPAALHESEFGFSEDLPSAILHVRVPRSPLPVVPYTPGPMLLAPARAWSEPMIPRVFHTIPSQPTGFRRRRTRISRC